METLEAYGWLWRQAGEYQKGHPTFWAINPAVHETFAAEAEEHRKRRKEVRKRLRGEDD